MLSLRWLLAVSVALTLFGNHYARDSVASLEWQIEGQLHLSPMAYNEMTSMFFFPNVCMPLVAGALSHTYGAAKTLTAFLAVAAVGHLVFAVGAGVEKPTLLMLGRMLSGMSYEVIDIMTIPLTSPYFQDGTWGILSGCVNGFIRLGSVVQFVLMPVVYRRYGIVAALWTASAMGSSGLILGVLSQRIAGILRRAQEEQGEGSKRGERMNVMEAFCEFDLAFWMYAAFGMLLYGAMVPFWFFGAKYFQQRFKMSVAASDALMLLPEGVMVVVALPLGMGLDRYGVPLRSRLLMMGAAMLAMAAAYASLALSAAPPLGGMLILGVAYSVVNVGYWASIPMVLQQHQMSAAAGVVGATMNVLPALLPLVMSSCTYVWQLMTLAALAVAAAAVNVAAVGLAERRGAWGASETRYKQLELTVVMTDDADWDADDDSDRHAVAVYSLE